MHLSRLGLALLAAVLLVGWVPGAAAEIMQLPPGAKLHDLEGRPGVTLTIEALGDLTVDGMLTTQAQARPGSDGPDIFLRVEGVLRLAPGARIIAADGRPGSATTAVGPAHGMEGGRGGDVVIEALLIFGNSAEIRAGSGGGGGAASSTGDPDALALGGHGGRGGRADVSPLPPPGIARFDGDGGHGGNATAHGRDGLECTGQDGADEADEAPQNLQGPGGDAEAQGGDGRCGVPGAKAGNGGDARAFGGSGGPAPDATGGRGGNAIALAGTGGAGGHACFDNPDEAERSGILQSGDGGDAGRFEARGGDGGPGTIGGAGGSAAGAAVSGAAGNSTWPILRGAPGNATSEAHPSYATGGNGGLGMIGGNGGGSSIVTKQGDFGGACGGGGFAILPTPSPSVAMVGLVVLAAASLLGRARTPPRSAPRL